MEEFRIEEDGLGKRKIPSSVYYGIQTLRAKENFQITRYKMDTDFIKAMGIVKKAYHQLLPGMPP